jgi:hypothetical protein
MYRAFGNVDHDLSDQRADDLLAGFIRYLGVVPCTSQIFAQQKQTLTIYRRENRLLIGIAHSNESLVPATFKLSGDYPVFRI